MRNARGDVGCRRGAVAALLTALTLVPGARACPVCRPKVVAGVYDARFVPTLGLLSVPFGVIAAVVFGVHQSDRGSRRAA